MPDSGRTTTPTFQFSKQLMALLLVLFGFYAPAQAVTVDGLYSVEVPVAGSSPQQLQAGYVEGLRRVLLRVSGSREIFQREEIGSVLEKAESLLQSYQFLRADGSGASNRLRMTFGSVGVNQALSTINAPVWGANRPLTLAWVAVQNSSGRQLVTAPGSSDMANSSRWHRAFQAAAANRGVPLALPPQSVAGDREVLSEVWGQFIGRIQQESEAIGHDLLAMVRINFDRNTWRASWLLDGRGLAEEVSSLTANSPEQMAELIVGRWADLMASRYAVAAGEVGASPQVDIVLDGVDSLDDYAAAKNALDSMTPVQNVGPISVKATQAILRVAFSGEISQLQEYMALDARFVPMQQVPASSGQGVLSQGGAPVSGPIAAEPVSSEPGVPAEAEAAGEGEASEQGQAAGEEGSMFSYQPLAVEAAESEEAFEALYPILHYRWQSSPVARPSGQE